MRIKLFLASCALISLGVGILLLYGYHTYSVGYDCARVAKELNLDTRNVWQIAKRLRWAHVE